MQWTRTLAIGMLLLSACDQNQTDVSSDLIDAFGGACSPVGSWSRNALRQNDALVQTFNALMQKDPCKPYMASLLTIQNAISQANKLLKDDNFLAYRAAEEQVQDLSLALQSPPSDPALLSQLQTQLITSEIDLYQKRAMSRASQTVSEKDRYAQATADLAQYLQSILTANQANGGITACLKSSPEAAVGIAGNLLALGGSFVSPVYGAGFAVVGQLLAMGVDYAQHSATVDAIYDLNAAKMPTALGCGLESMTELYCNAEGSFALLQLKKDSVHSPIQAAPIWRGIDLLTNRMPVLNEWLMKVKNGVAPTDPVLAYKQNEILEKMTTVEKKQNSVFASLSEYQQKYQTSATDQKDNVMVRAIVEQIANIGLMEGGPGVSVGYPMSNPFVELTTDSKTYACWFVLGPNAICPKPDDSYMQTENYIRKFLLGSASFSGLFNNWKAIHDAVKTQVENEFSKTITANPSSLIADAYESLPSNVSPHRVLEMLIEYFVDLKASGGANNPGYKPHLEESIRLVQDVLASLNASNASTSEAKIESIFRTLQLNRGLEIFSNRVSRIVDWDLNAKLKNGEFPNELKDMLTLAGVELRDRLTQAGQGGTDSDLQKDLNNARSIAQANIQIFRDYFSSAFGKSVERLHRAAVEAGEPERGPNRPNGQTLGHLCTLIIATGKEWPKGLDPQICEKAYLDPLYAGQGSPAFSIEVGKLARELQGKPYQTRFCAYHRYRRAERLAELPNRGQQSTHSLSSALSALTSQNLLEMIFQ